MELLDLFNNLSTEESIYMLIILFSVISIIFNFFESRKDSTKGSQLYINISAIITSIITTAIFSYILYVKNDDLLVAGYSFGILSGIANFFSLLYFFNFLRV